MTAPKLKTFGLLNTMKGVAFFFPLNKGVEDGTGMIHIEGVFTDESVDLEKMIVKSSENPGAFSLVEKGLLKLNYNHGKEIVGDVTELKLIPARDACEMYPTQGGCKTVGMVGILKARIFPLVPESGEDLRNVRQLAKNFIKFASPVGFSIQGGAQSVRKGMDGGKPISIAVPSIIPLISITPCPVNTSTFMLAKSFGDFIDALQKSEVAATAPGAMSTTGIIPQDGTEGGDAAKVSEISAKKKGKKKMKKSCDTVSKCNCGGKCKEGVKDNDKTESDDANIVPNLLKAMAQLFAENK